ncbi:unnamed protein product [Pleuronectes platessa]|uniref:Uncharacterized protein n=1 Tax=Pleuronectes platessa TaxID=8262 RepID=A0A9N7Z1T4_PLEPL|nr:unnamed protein product [Pleuronectes platessa]
MDVYTCPHVFHHVGSYSCSLFELIPCFCVDCRPPETNASDQNNLLLCSSFERGQLSKMSGTLFPEFMSENTSSDETGPYMLQVSEQAIAWTKIRCMEE